MHLAILMTNTDESAFAQRHPKDGEKFAQLIHSVKPHWQVTSYDVKDNQFPHDITAYDGIIITGSPASVNDPLPWINTLLDTIRIAYRERIPMFGACFGHQAIALALGGKVERNEAGWGFGLVDMQVIDKAPWLESDNTLLQYAAHIEHVTALPEGATILFTTDHCPNAGFTLNHQIYTTQNHPEMTPDFIAALIDECEDEMDDDVIARARASLNRVADYDRFAESVVAFFETAR